MSFLKYNLGTTPEFLSERADVDGRNDQAEWRQNQVGEHWCSLPLGTNVEKWIAFVMNRNNHFGSFRWICTYWTISLKKSLYLQGPIQEHGAGGHVADHADDHQYAGGIAGDADHAENNQPYAPGNQSQDGDDRASRLFQNLKMVKSSCLSRI